MSLNGVKGFFVAWVLIALSGILSGLAVSFIGFFVIQEAGEASLLNYMLPIVSVFTLVASLVYPIVRLFVYVVKLTKPVST